MTKITDSPTRHDVAECALSQYECLPCSTDVLRPGGSMAYCVRDTRGDTYVLNVRRSAYKFFYERWETPAAVRSEMVWRSFLYRDTDVVVQEPLRTKEGDWIATVEVAGRPAPCTLVRWIEGECPYDRGADRGRPLSKAEAGQAGILLARLHNVAETWSPPSEFVRPHYNGGYIRDELETARLLIQRNVIRPADFELIEQALEQIIPIMVSLGESVGISGMLHGDFFESNLLFCEGSAIPIDFAECGFGPYLRDLGQCLFHLRISDRTVFLDAYQSIRDLPDDGLRLAEAFMITHCVRWLAFVFELPDRYGKAAEAAPLIARRYCQKFIAGESFITTGSIWE